MDGAGGEDSAVPMLKQKSRPMENHMMANLPKLRVTNQ